MPQPGATRGRIETQIDGESFSAPCALGRGGAVAAAIKREGDGATPLGDWPLRRVYYRMDRVAPPLTLLPVEPIRADLGWCDDPADPHYNQPVTLPYAASHERMLRQDALYDLVVVLGHNDAPVIPGQGSAIFWHLARPDWQPTAGCIATRPAVLQRLLVACDTDSLMRIRFADQATGEAAG